MRRGAPARAPAPAGAGRPRLLLYPSRLPCAGTPSAVTPLESRGQFRPHLHRARSASSARVTRRWQCGGLLMTGAAAGKPQAVLYTRDFAVAPGGVNSTVRAFGAVGGTQVFMASGRGAYLTGACGTSYVVLVCS